jgi:hypothetical protein
LSGAFKGLFRFDGVLTNWRSLFLVEIYEAKRWSIKTGENRPDFHRILPSKLRYGQSVDVVVLAMGTDKLCEGHLSAKIEGDDQAVVSALSGAPHNGLSMLIWQIGRRISNGTAGRPQRCHDFQCRYNLKPALGQQITVSGFTVVSALMIFGTKRYSPTKIKRSMTLTASLFGCSRRWMLS